MNITVIVPTYNYAKYIGKAIESILVQDLQRFNIEIIVIDDGSTDNTEKVVNNCNDSRIKYFQQENKGKANATRRAIAMASGKYIFNLDADDYFLPDKLQKSIEIFEANPDVVHVASPALCINEITKQQGVETIPEFLLERVNEGKEVLLYFYQNKILYGGGSTFAARAEVLKQINIPDVVDMYIDEYLILATLSYGSSFFFKEPLSVWRIHGSNYSAIPSAQRLQKKEERLLSSSLGVLNALHDLNMEKEIIKIYELQHKVRVLAAKEHCRKKDLNDILELLIFLIRARYSFKIAKNQTAFNRLLPTQLLLLLKKLKYAFNSCFC